MTREQLQAIGLAEDATDDQINARLAALVKNESDTPSGDEPTPQDPPTGDDPDDEPDPAPVAPVVDPDETEAGGTTPPPPAQPPETVVVDKAQWDRVNAQLNHLTAKDAKNDKEKAEGERDSALQAAMMAGKLPKRSLTTTKRFGTQTLQLPRPPLTVWPQTPFPLLKSATKAATPPLRTIPIRPRPSLPKRRQLSQKPVKERKKWHRRAICPRRIGMRPMTHLLRDKCSDGQDVRRHQREPGIGSRPQHRHQQIELYTSVRARYVRVGLGVASYDAGVGRAGSCANLPRSYCPGHRRRNHRGRCRSRSRLGWQGHYARIRQGCGQMPLLVQPQTTTPKSGSTKGTRETS